MSQTGPSAISPRRLARSPSHGARMPGSSVLAILVAILAIPLAGALWSPGSTHVAPSPTTTSSPSSFAAAQLADAQRTLTSDRSASAGAHPSTGYGAAGWTEFNGSQPPGRAAGAIAFQGLNRKSV